MTTLSGQALSEHDRLWRHYASVRQRLQGSLRPFVPVYSPPVIRTAAEIREALQARAAGPETAAYRELEILGAGSPTIRSVQDAVALAWGMTRNELNSRRQARDCSIPRQISMCLSKVLTPRSLPEIGWQHGRRDHTTVMHAIRKYANMINGLLAQMPSERRPERWAECAHNILKGIRHVDAIV